MAAALASTPTSFSPIPSFSSSTERSRCLLSSNYSSFFSQNSSFISVSTSFNFTEFNRSRICVKRVRTVVSASADYYSTLGVSKSADNKEIKAAYRKLARQVPLVIMPNVS